MGSGAGSGLVFNHFHRILNLFETEWAGLYGPFLWCFFSASCLTFSVEDIPIYQFSKFEWFLFEFLSPLQSKDLNIFSGIQMVRDLINSR